MGRGFDRVRLSALAVGAGSAVAAAVAPDAFAAPVTGPVTITTNDARWAGIGGLVHTAYSFSYAPPYTIGAATTFETVPSRFDAFDGAFATTVNGAVYRDKDGIVDVTGLTVTSTGRVKGLKTTVEHRFFGNRPTLRALFSFKNPSTKARTVTIQILSNAGSDNNTDVEATSDGNTTFGTNDSWAVTSDNGAGPDPVIVWGVGTASGLTTVPDGGEDDLVQTFVVKVGPGKTRRVLVFAHLRRLIASATTDASSFTNEMALVTAGLTTGLSPQQLAQIINWNF